jgi:adenylate kinase family enzyme
LERRIHITGASGVGTSTLARALATRLESQQFDTDDFYWHPTDPPFTSRRPIEERLDLMARMFLPRPDWVLAGSCVGWGDPLIPRFTHVVFMTLPSGARLARLRARERRRHGAAIGPGGALEERFRGFLDWAMGYDDSDFQGRSRRMHEDWLARLGCPVIRLDGGAPAPELVEAVVAALDAAEHAA